MTRGCVVILFSVSDINLVVCFLMRHNIRGRDGDYITPLPGRRRFMDVVKEDMKLIGVEAEDAKNRVTLILGQPLRRPAESGRQLHPMSTILFNQKYFQRQRQNLMFNFV